jgi:hypothetical protein
MHSLIARDRADVGTLMYMIVGPDDFGPGSEYANQVRLSLERVGRDTLIRLIVLGDDSIREYSANGVLAKRLMREWFGGTTHDTVLRDGSSVHVWDGYFWTFALGFDSPMTCTRGLKSTQGRTSKRLPIGS